MSSEKVKVYISCGGGLGDVIQSYLSNPPNHWNQSPDTPDEFPTSDNYISIWFRRLEDFKVKNPLSSIIVKAMCHNPAVKQLFEYHPAIDYIDLITYDIPNGDNGEWWRKEFNGYKNIRYLESDDDDNRDYEKYNPVDAKIYLDYHEKCHARIITSLGKYVVLHPFAGLKHREPVGTKTYNEIADRFIDAGYSVVVIGSSYKRNVADQSYSIEEFDRDTDGKFFNLMGFSVREFIYLILNSDGFVGTHSSMVLPAWYKKKQSVCIVPTTHDGGQAWDEFANSGNPTAWGFRQKFNKTLIVEQDHLSSMDINDIVGWIDVS